MAESGATSGRAGGAGLRRTGLPAVAVGQRHLSAGELREAHDAATRAAEFGDRFGEADLIAFARNLQGRALLSEGRLDRGLALLDEAMVAATSGELSPVVTGIIYCSAIASCHRVYALDRVREWTAALTSWCEAHPQLGMFTGHCLVHRAEIMQMSGSWPEAVEEARRAVERCVRAIEREAGGRAHYQEAEIQRLRGEFAAAEAAYRNASRSGMSRNRGWRSCAWLRATGTRRPAPSVAWSGQPAIGCSGRGSCLRTSRSCWQWAISTRRAPPAWSWRRRHRASTPRSWPRWPRMPAERCSWPRGTPAAVLDPARRAFGIWQQIGAPYLAARVRVLLARACLALGDVDGARLELDGAREVFDGWAPGPTSPRSRRSAPVSTATAGKRPGRHGLTERELQVLRLIASGKTNKAIARELSLSEKTVDRHVSNIFTKVDVSSRAAATAFAYEHELI